MTFGVRSFGMRPIASRRRAPIRRCEERADDVGEHGKTEEFEYASEGRIGHQDLGERDRQPDRQHEPDSGNADQQLYRRGNRADVRADVYGVRDRKKCHNGHEPSPTTALLEIRRKTSAADEADARTNGLHGDVQREREKTEPEELIAECCAGNRVGGDSAGIVVRDARDEAGAKAVDALTKLSGSPHKAKIDGSNERKAHARTITRPGEPA